jgi:DNA-binding response OmpR family regulator
MSQRILLIDDDRELCELLQDYLRLEGFDADAIHDGAEAVAHCHSHRYDALVLDIMLPGMLGLDVLRQIRKHDDVPVLMLTARGEDTDRIIGLELGADDYLPKPCNPRELSARLRAIFRRTASAPEHAQPDNFDLEGIMLNSRNRTALFGQQNLSLTGAEFKLLMALMRQAGEAVDKETLAKQALGRTLSAYDRSIDVHISHLRKKLNACGAPNLIASVRGVGYQFLLGKGESK